MKKMYQQPETDILAVNSERMMQDLTVSVNGGSGSEHPVAGAPASRGGDIID